MRELITGVIFGAARVVHALEGAVTPTVIRASGVVALIGIAVSVSRSTIRGRRARRASLRRVGGAR
jgi:hypothetical protein